MPSQFRVETLTHHSLERLFDVSLDIDAHVASMSRSGETAVGGVRSGTIGRDETVTWRARHFGVWFTMTSRITALDRPHRFVDQQIAGPFRAFVHEHTFTRDGDNTRMIDTITVASPVLGRLVERSILVPYLRRLITQRNQSLVDRLDREDGRALTTPAAAMWGQDVGAGFRRSEVSAVIGSGDDPWMRASRDVLAWRVKTRSGFTVDSAEPVAPGQQLAIVVHVLGVAIIETVEVIAVVHDADRVGFAYRTLPGHPVDGEEAFIVHREGDDVRLTVRSLTRAAPQQPWCALHPLLRIAQRVVRRRYLRALR